MLNPKDARQLSEMVKAPCTFPEVKKQITRTLFDYYKELLHRPPHPPIPRVRRMW